MKVRVLGTSTNKYLKNFQEVPIDIVELLVQDNGTSFYLYDPKSHTNILTFDSDVTRRQCIEIWTLFGWVKSSLGKLQLIKSRSFEDLVEKVKDSLLKLHADTNAQAFINMKLLALEATTRNISNEELINLNITQLRGKVDSTKLKKEINKIENEILKDYVFLTRMRKVLYDKIDKEL